MRKFFNRRSNQLFVVFVLVALSSSAFQNCARAKFKNPEMVIQAAAQSACVDGQTEPCEDESGSGSQCKEVSPGFQLVCAKTTCKTGFHLDNLVCVRDPEPTPTPARECETGQIMFNGRCVFP